MKKYTLRIETDGVPGKVVRFDDIDKIEQVADKLLGWGETDVLGRTPFEKKRGRIKKDGPVIDVWCCHDLLATRPFRIVAVETRHIDTKTVT